MFEDILQEDFNLILDSELDMQSFSKSSFLITGATGLVGSLLVKFLLYANKERELDIKVYALIRNLEKAEKIYSEFLTDPTLEFITADLGKNNIILNDSVDYIIHLAAITQSKIMISNPVETINTAVNGTEEILQLAVKHHVKAMVYVSSMEVYGQTQLKNKICETDLGYVDLTSVRSCYPESKRMCELLCTAYSDQYKLNVKIARLAQTFGAGILPTENRVFAQFARSIINHQDIVLHTQGNSEGNYVYTADAIKALLLLLLFGESKEAYNVSNEENHMTIKEMANLVISEFGTKNEKVLVDIPAENMGYAPEVHMWLDNSKLCMLGWRPTRNMVESYKRMIVWMNSIENRRGK